MNNEERVNNNKDAEVLSDEVVIRLAEQILNEHIKAFEELAK